MVRGPSRRSVVANAADLIACKWKSGPRCASGSPRSFYSCPCAKRATAEAVALVQYSLTSMMVRTRRVWSGLAGSGEPPSSVRL